MRQNSHEWLPNGNGCVDSGGIFQRNGTTPHTVCERGETGLSDVGGPGKCLQEGCPGLWAVEGKTLSLSPILWSSHLNSHRLSPERI